jgi:hypothetical protein
MRFESIGRAMSQTVLIWSDVLPRIRYRGAYENNKMEKTRKTFNSAMHAYIRRIGGKAIRHQEIKWKIYFDRMGCT